MSSRSPDKKRFLSSSTYYAPKLPSGTRQLSIDSTRVAGDFQVSHVGSEYHRSLNGVPIPEDVHSKLVQVGMKVRKNVADGHKVMGSIPSYQPNFSLTQSIYGQQQQQQQQLAARKFYSENDKYKVSLKPARGVLKRTREVTEEANEEDDATDDDEEDDNNNNTVVSNNNNYVSSLSLNNKTTSEKAVRKLSNRSGTIASSKIFYVPASASSSYTAQEDANEDFGEAPFLDPSVL